MADEKVLPPCDEFLVSAIRYLRKNRKEREGVRVHQVYNAAREFYPDEEIRKTLNTKLDNKILLIVARKVPWEDEKPGTGKSIVLDRIVDKYPLENVRWNFTAEGTPAGVRGELRTSYSQIFLYVVADGLPENVRKILRLATVQSPTAPTIGERILDWMKMDEGGKKKSD